MRKQAYDGARPECPSQDTGEGLDFLLEVWAPFNRGYGFVAALDRATEMWRDASFKMSDPEPGLVDFFDRYPANEYDLYFCPNAFREAKRKAECAKRTPWLWADIDDADPGAFEPPPGILWRTSPGRTQGLWPLDRRVSVDEAQAMSKALANRHGADSGWSITKMLRIPGTINHKPDYDRPRVKLLRADWTPTDERPALIASPSRGRLGGDADFDVDPYRFDPREVLRRYGRDMHLKAKLLSRTRYATPGQRSENIFCIGANLRRAGASSDEIAAVIFASADFRSKHGADLSRLNDEVLRICEKVEVGR